jgi:hypothetical protein
MLTASHTVRKSFNPWGKFEEIEEDETERRAESVLKLIPANIIKLHEKKNLCKVPHIIMVSFLHIFLLLLPPFLWYVAGNIPLS